MKPNKTENKGNTGIVAAPAVAPVEQAVKQHVDLKNKDKGKVGIFEMKTKNRKTGKDGTRFIKGEIVDIERGKTIVHIREEGGEVKKLEAEAILDFIPKKMAAPTAATATAAPTAPADAPQAGAPAPAPVLSQTV